MKQLTFEEEEYILEDGLCRVRDRKHNMNHDEDMPGVAETSRLAYYSIRCELDSRKTEVFGVIDDSPGFCNREIAFVLGLPINSVTPRVKELRDLGLVVCSGVKVDSMTGRSVKTWKVKIDENQD